MGGEELQKDEDGDMTIATLCQGTGGARPVPRFGIFTFLSSPKRSVGTANNRLSNLQGLVGQRAMMTERTWKADVVEIPPDTPFDARHANNEGGRF